jgi:hypothetical protein
MGKKRRGHYCRGCGINRPNEKFSGKGHKQHICKDCKRKGNAAPPLSTSEYDRQRHYLSKAIKSCMIMYSEREDFFLFEFQKKRYITRDDFESEIFVYQKNRDQDFFVEEALYEYAPLLEVLSNKYYDALENGLAIEYEELMWGEAPESQLTKKRKKYLELIFSINNLDLS